MKLGVFVFMRIESNEWSLYFNENFVPNNGTNSWLFISFPFGESGREKNH